MKMNITKFMVVVAFLVQAQFTFAGGQSGEISVKSIRYAGGGDLYIVFDPALNDCHGGTNFRSHARLDNNHGNYKNISAALLTAYITGQPLYYVAYSGEIAGTACSGNGHTLTLDWIELLHK